MRQLGIMEQLQQTCYRPSILEHVEAYNNLVRYRVQISREGTENTTELQLEQRAFAQDV